MTHITDMPTQATSFSCIVVVHLFNGLATSIDGYGVIRPENDKNQPLPEETVTSLIRLAQILRPIYMRILASGYNISNGKLVKSEPKV